MDVESAFLLATLAGVFLLGTFAGLVLCTFRGTHDLKQRDDALRLSEAKLAEAERERDHWQRVAWEQSRDEWWKRGEPNPLGDCE